MCIEFKYPPHSSEIITSVDIPAPPSVGDTVYLGEKHYKVIEVEWCIFEDRQYIDPGRCGVIVHIIEHPKR